MERMEKFLSLLKESKVVVNELDAGLGVQIAKAKGLMEGWVAAMRSGGVSMPAMMRTMKEMLQTTQPLQGDAKPTTTFPD